MLTLIKPVLVCGALFTTLSNLYTDFEFSAARAQERTTVVAPYCSAELRKYLNYAKGDMPLYRCTQYSGGHFTNLFCNDERTETSPISQALIPFTDSTTCEPIELNRGLKDLVEEGGGLAEPFVQAVLDLPPADLESVKLYVDAYDVGFFRQYQDQMMSAVKRLPTGKYMIGYPANAPFWSAQELLLRLRQIDILQRSEAFVRRMGSDFELRIMGFDNDRAAEIINYINMHQDQVAAILNSYQIRSVLILDEVEAATHKTDCTTVVLSDSMQETHHFLRSGKGRFENRFPRENCGG